MSCFTVNVPVKSYIKIFLENNCGFPVDLVNLPALKTIFRNSLRKPSKRYDYKMVKIPDIYKENVNIIISEDEFYRFGWELSKTDVIAFNKEIENMAKLLMRNIVGVSNSIGLPINKSIEKFQAEFNFSEEDWTYQTIKKDFYRNSAHVNIDFDNEIFRKINLIILENLYKKGTISQKFKKQYEKAK
jgi:hypothetical protein